jgi:hypothetical protein
MPPSRIVALVRIDASGEHIASIIRVTLMMEIKDFSETSGHMA